MKFLVKSVSKNEGFRKGIWDGLEEKFRGKINVPKQKFLKGFKGL